MYFLDDLWLFEADPINFNRFTPWRQHTGSGVPEWFPMWRTCFLYDLPLSEIGLVEHGVLPRWRQQTGSSVLHIGVSRSELIRAQYNVVPSKNLICDNGRNNENGR